MYMIEISEDKFDDALEHMSKGIKCIAKAIEMLDTMRTSDDSRMDYYERSRHRMGGSDRPDMDRDQYRSGGGRYGRY